MSKNGVGAHDPISRKTTLKRLMQVDGGRSTLPFARVFYGTPPEYYWWENDCGQIHSISHGEGGEQGDAMMPFFFTLGQHSALESTNRSLKEREFMCAFLDDIYFITAPARVGAVYAALQEALFAHAHIAIHLGTTKVWNSSGTRPEICAVLERMAPDSDRRSNG